MVMRWGVGVGILVIVTTLAFRAGRWWESIERDSFITEPLPTVLPWPPPSMTGLLSPNYHLQNVSKIGQGVINQPEDLAYDPVSGMLYASCADGFIYRVSVKDKTVTPWQHVGGHGRPLGLAVGLHGEVLACDPFKGLLNVTDGGVHVLTTESTGVKMKFADGVDVGRDGEVYFTDASTKYGFGFSDNDVFEASPNGRLLVYSPSTNTTTELLKGLYFPNGVALSSNNTFLVFCETSMVRCMKYWLKGKKKGQTEVFIDNLPGYPDNIKLGNNGVFWIGLVSRRSAMWEMMFRVPSMKKVVSAKKEIMQALGKEAFKVARVVGAKEDENGKARIVKMYDDPNGSTVSFITTALQVGDCLYLGGFGISFVAFLPIQ